MAEGVGGRVRPGGEGAKLRLPASSPKAATGPGSRPRLVQVPREQGGGRPGEHPPGPAVRGHRGPPPDAGGSRGFTLMEVLVALALVSLLAGVLLQVMTVGLRAQKSSQLSAQALEVAGNVLQEFTREGGRRLVQGRRIGQDGNFTYQVTVEPQYQVAVPPPMNTRVTCFLVRVTVSWQERGRTRSLGLTTMRTVSQKPA